MQQVPEKPERLLAAARLRGQLIAADPARGPSNADAAYALQRCTNEIISGSLGPVGGLKIGCTTPVMRSFLGIDSPAAGEIFSSTIHHAKAVIRHADFIRVGIECEIAVRIGTTISPGHTAPASVDVVDAVLAAAEIVDDRYADYRTLGVNWLIADNFFNAGAVLAEPVRNWRSLDLAGLEGRTIINGEVIGSGLGASVMGHPFHALDWLISRRLASGVGIAAGSVVLLGSVVETKWLRPGDAVKTEIAGLGSIALQVS